jgi:hypothetical protein
MTPQDGAPNHRICFVGTCGKPDINAPDEGTWPTCSKYPPACVEHIGFVPPPQRKASLTSAAPGAPPNGASLIAAERARQRTEEGWTSAHDDEYEDAQLVRAAICFAEAHSGFALDGVDTESLWPWNAPFFKVDLSDAGRIRGLVKAGALIAAEIDRLQRGGA